MADREFKTSEVLAAMHSFPAVMAVSSPEGSVIESFDRLRDISPQIAGIKHQRDHLGWTTLSQALRPALKEAFPDLAKESIPDNDYWSGPKDGTIDPIKKARLAEWVASMEGIYGATLTVPDIKVAVEANLAKSAQAQRE